MIAIFCIQSKIHPSTKHLPVTFPLSTKTATVKPRASCILVESFVESNSHVYHPIHFKMSNYIQIWRFRWVELTPFRFDLNSRVPILSEIVGDLMSTIRFIIFSVHRQTNEFTRPQVTVGGLAQLVERVLSMHEVSGSIPEFSILLVLSLQEWIFYFFSSEYGCSFRSIHTCNLEFILITPILQS